MAGDFYLVLRKEGKVRKNVGVYKSDKFALKFYK